MAGILKFEIDFSQKRDWVYVLNWVLCPFVENF